MSDFKDLTVFTRIKDRNIIRVAAFGSSNTQRYQPGMHWFDYVELGFKNSFGGGCGQFINSGISGNTTQDLLNRFEQELALFKPHLVIMTIGGNDANPERNITPEKFRDNLLELERKISDLGAQIIFQTYYACDLENIDHQYAVSLEKYMQIIREVAEQTGHLLMDHFARWEKLRRANGAIYRLLMKNPMHVNSSGNMVMGLDLARNLGLTINEVEECCREGLFVQTLLDQLGKA